MDLVLGLVGGFVGLLWGFLNILFGGYQAFKLENSLISAIYPTSPQRNSDSGENYSQDNAPQNEKAAKRAMMNTVAERGKYWYSYSEYLFVSIMSAICCCCVSRCSSF